jgi:hypothetical protein
MKLPTIQSPKYALTLPSTKKTVEYRPFLVKEEKILLIAQESGDQEMMTRAIHEVISNCTEGKIDPGSITSFDLEYIFLKLRAKSVGEIAKIGLVCPSCGDSTPVSINLDTIELVGGEPLPKKIMITDSVGIVPRYLSAKKMAELSKIEDKGELFTSTLAASIETIFDSDTVYPVDEASKEELDAFLGSLNRTQLESFEKVLSAVPRLEKEIVYSCTGCKAENKTTLSGLQSFFE